jgi:UDP-2,4-diacetamido-2,4,6-trideoxy-beta-L-altropyranose hydrolase
MMRTAAFFRVDASPAIGGGHLSRCLALASQLAERGASVCFLSAPLDQSYERQITARGYELMAIALEKHAHESPLAAWLDADAQFCAKLLAASPRQERRVLIVDHYSLDRRWHLVLRSSVDTIGVIDDLANRSHDCDVVIDQAYGGDASRYAGLVPDRCVGLFGTRYALLRPEFAQWRDKRMRSTRASGRPRVIHVFFGTEDTKANSLRFARLLLRIDPALEIRVAVSARYPDPDGLDELRRSSDGRMSWEMVGPRMAEHMAGCDVAVGAPGQATWERACLGLPAIYVPVSDNQVAILERLRAAGLCAYLDIDRNLSDEAFQHGCSSFLSNVEELEAMSARALSAVDGLGSVRVAEHVLSSTLQ